MKKERNPNIELWRCFCMFAVVFCHVLTNNNLFPMHVFRWHVPGFLLISGYFGIRFSFQKMLKLIGIAYACYWLTIPFRWGQDSIFSLLLPHGSWFLPFYCTLMVMSPFLNAALSAKDYRKPVLWSIIALNLIAWIPTFGTNLHLAMIKIPGMQGKALLMMMSLYVFGAYLRAYDVGRRLPAIGWFLLFIIGIALCVVLGSKCPSAVYYSTPIAYATSICGFLGFAQARPAPSLIGKVVNFIAPSMFSVFLIHECCIRKYQIMNGGDMLDAFILAVILFLGCIAVDMVRRAIEKGIQVLIEKRKVCKCCKTN